MSVLIDTSVWVDFFNGHPSPEAEMLAELIEEEVEIGTCGVVLAELFQGIRQEHTLRRLRSYFEEMAYLRPREPETYLAAADLYRGLRRQGVTVRSTIDCLIVGLAAEHDFRVLAKDRDFRAILASDLCRAEAVPLPDGTGSSRHERRGRT